jgi:hypothetical protein
MWWAERYAGQVMENGQYIVDDKPIYYLSLVKPSKYNYSVDVIKDIPCWSLTALLEYLKNINPTVYIPMLYVHDNKWMLQFVERGHGNVAEVECDNPIDTCYEMIIKLHEQKLL